MLQHMGRSMMLVFLRMVLAGVVLGAPILLGAVLWFSDADLSQNVRIAVVGAAAAACLLVADVALIFAGGWALRRFDVSQIPR